MNDNNVPNNVYYYFRNTEALFAYARKHPELNFGVFGETRKGWLSVGVSPRDVANTDANNNNNTNNVVVGSEVESF